MKLETDYIEKLAKIMNNNGLTAISLEDGEQAITIRKDAAEVVTVAAPAMAVQTPAPAPQVQAAEEPAAPPSTGRDFDIPGQIIEQARLIRRAENTEMVIQLKPEHLGELTLRVTVTQNGAVNASFYSDNPQVRGILENSLVQLKQDLSAQGIKVDNVEVYAGLSEDSLLNGQSQQGWQQGQQGGSSGRNRQADFESYEDESANLSSQSGILSANEGVDYKV